MEVEEAIRGRRSIRKYKKGKPKEEEINKVLKAGTWAPSGLNNQPWKFKLVQDKAKRDWLAGFTKYGKTIRSAPIVICVFLNHSASYNREKDIMAVGACVQNMLLEAHKLGLGACWMGEILNKKEKAEKYLGAGAGYELMAVVTLGYPNEIARSKRKSLKSFIL